jgi:hypothetical protein
MYVHILGTRGSTVAERLEIIVKAKDPGFGRMTEVKSSWVKLQTAIFQ